MGILQQKLPDQLLEPTGVHLLLHGHKQVAHFQIGRGVAAVEPAFQGVEAKDQTLGIGAKVPLPQLELGIGHDGLQLFPVQALFSQFFQLGSNELLHSRQILFLDVLHIQHQPGLQHTVVDAHVHFLGQAGRQDRLAQRGLVAAAEHLGQDLGSDQFLPVGKGTDDLTKGQPHLALQRLAGCQLIFALAPATDGLLHYGRSHALGALVMAQVLIIDDGKNLLDVHSAVQEHIGIGGSVEPAMAVDKGFVGQIRNGSRVAAGLIAIGRVGEQQTVQFPVYLAVGACKGALHLVKDHALVAGIAVVVQLIVPAFLVENFRFGIDQRTEHRIQVHPHQIDKILVVAAADGVHGLVLEGQGVEEGVHGTFQQLHKGLFHGILVRAAQHAVLQNVEHAGVVPGQGFEGDAKGLVFLVTAQPNQLQTGLFMDHAIKYSSQFRQFGGLYQRKAAEVLVFQHSGVVLLFFMFCIVL